MADVNEKTPLIDGAEKAQSSNSPRAGSAKSPEAPESGGGRKSQSPPGSAKTSPTQAKPNASPVSPPDSDSAFVSPDSSPHGDTQRGKTTGDPETPAAPRNTPMDGSPDDAVPGRGSPTSNQQSPPQGSGQQQGGGSSPGSGASRQTSPTAGTSQQEVPGIRTSPPENISEAEAGEAARMMEAERCSRRASKCLRCLSFFLMFLIGLGGGFAAGWLGRQKYEKTHNMTTTLPKHWIMDELNADNIKENLKDFTHSPHLAGTEQAQRMAGHIEDMWKRQGLDYVSQEQYKVLMSYPDSDDPSRVELLDGSRVVTFQSQIQEKILTSDQNNPDIVMPYGAYSPAGNVTGPLVFVNYGRIEDFKRLVKDFNITCTGKIAIVKHGKTFRADMVTFAAEHGCEGVILYSDPKDYSPGPGEPFPASWWLPSTGVQRGTVYSSIGDPLTPGYPATESAYRWSENKVAGLPKIPVHVISYGDAETLLSKMAGPVAPTDWHGSLPLTYRIGGSMQGNQTVNLKVSTSNQQANISNVLGFIKGEAEPDRYVLLGNHRDAWVFGGVGPSTGTAVMMEVSRAFAQLLKKGIRPRRTIIFCSWGAGEPGLVGSTEWVENYIKNLGSRAVVYINLDSAVSGNSTFKASAVPLLYDALYAATGQVKSPNDDNITMYEEWLKVDSDQFSVRPTIGALGSDSDHAAFINMAGVSSVDVSYTHDPNLGLASAPCDHSACDTFFLFSKYIDPEFKYSLAMARVVSLLLVEFADAPLLRIMNVSQYYAALQQYTQTLEEEHGQHLGNHSIHLDALKSAVNSFGYSVIEFEERLKTVNPKDELDVRRLNDQLMQLERAFIDPHGVPQQPIYKHLISAPSKFNSYVGAAFPGLENLLFDIDAASDQAERWEEIRRHLAAIVFVIQSAESALAPVNAFNWHSTVPL